MVSEGEGVALGWGVVVSVNMDGGVNVMVEDTVPVGYGMGVGEGLRGKLGLSRVKASRGVSGGSMDAALTGFDGSGKAVAGTASHLQAIEHKPRARQARAMLYVLRMCESLGKDN